MNGKPSSWPMIIICRSLATTYVPCKRKGSLVIRLMRRRWSLVLWNHVLLLVEYALKMKFMREFYFLQLLRQFLWYLPGAQMDLSWNRCLYRPCWSRRFPGIQLPSLMTYVTFSWVELLPQRLHNRTWLAHPLQFPWMKCPFLTLVMLLLQELKPFMINSNLGCSPCAVCGVNMRRLTMLMKGEFCMYRPGICIIHTNSDANDLVLYV